jgi:hypothetical protein
MPLKPDKRVAVPCFIISLYFKEGRILLSHGLQKQTTIKKEISHLATRLGNKKTAMAGSAMGRSISASIIRFMIGADRVVRAYSEALQRVPKDIGKSGSGGDETPSVP